MPKNATMDQRIAWHLKHAKHCGCREIPRTVAQAVKQRDAHRGRASNQVSRRS
jgi:hypothetical protein